MTRDELLTQLRLIRKRQDNANNEPWEEQIDGCTGHTWADDLLLEFINDEEIKEAYEDIDRWYE